jgi:SAM-dependent methyltransferase
MTAAPFDPARVRRRRTRAVATIANASFLHTRAADDLAGRLEAVNRSFARALVLGGGRFFRAALEDHPVTAGRIGAVTAADWAEGDVLCDPERLPFGDECFDLVVSLLALHAVNDLPGTLIQIRRALKPDGLFIGALFGGRTLAELRDALLAAEVELCGGAALRIAPFADALDVAGLLQRAGFALPVADRDTTIVRYRDPLHLLQDLRAMGETSALAEPAPPLTRGILLRAMEIYRARHGEPDGRARATFDILTATGWAPHESQQKPLRPGSAKMRLADALGVKEQSAGEKPNE